MVSRIATAALLLTLQLEKLSPNYCMKNFIFSDSYELKLQGLPPLGCLIVAMPVFSILLGQAGFLAQQEGASYAWLGKPHCFEAPRTWSST